MTTEYVCLKCRHRFVIEVSDRELASSLEPDRTDACPKCGQPVGSGPVQCRRCGLGFTLAFPHWHVSCDLAGGDCPACATRYTSPCIC
jgi:DNA-directed RNA polymerase subunit RPC12/RpoP